MANFFDQFDSKPAANYFDQFDPAVPQSSVAQELTGIPKQIGAGLIEGAASIPGSVPQTLGQIGSVISNMTGLPNSPSIPYSLTPQGQLSAALPSPQTGAQQAARTFSQFPLSAVSARGHLGQNIVGGIGAGLGAILGPEVGPYFGLSPDEGAIAGALTGGFAGAKGEGIRENAVARQKMPSPQEVLNNTSDVYNVLSKNNKQIILPPDAMRIIKDGALNLLKSQGPSEEDAKSVYSIINGLDADNGGTVADLINARRNLKGHFEGGPDANKPAAIMMMNVIDTMLEKVAAPGTLTELRKSDANWSAARAAQAVTAKVNMAEDAAEGANSGLNKGNKIIQSINSYIKSRTDSIGKVHMDPSDLEALNDVRKPPVGEKLERYISNLGGGGGGLGAVIAAGAGAGLGAGANELGLSATDKDPLWGALGLPALGLLARTGFNASIARQAKNAEAQILARSPYVQGLGSQAPGHLLPLHQVAGRSLLFAAPQIRDLLAPQPTQ